MAIENNLNYLASDGRHFQILAQVTFLSFGILMLGWDADFLNYLAILVGALGTQLLFTQLLKIPISSVKSALITSLGLCLLLKTNSPFIFFFAATLAIAQKFVFRYRNKHLWNPANFGIILAIVLSENAWVSPGQWGTEALVVLAVSTLGFAVLTKVKRLDTGLIFIATIAALEFSRTILYMNWNWEVWLHKMSSGSIWLFAFFMITDPMTTPDNKKARIIWTLCVASISFYLTNFHFINSSVQWVLFFATPLTPLIDHLIKSEKFQWSSSQLITQSKKMFPMKAIIKILILCSAIITTKRSFGFCGFYVAKADATLFNNKSEVILVRDGKKTVITMSNDFSGDFKDFAMVVPVPVVLRRDQINVVRRDVFEYLDAYSAPRLVEYHDQNPCYIPLSVCDNVSMEMLGSVNMTSMKRSEATSNKYVKIEARYQVGEYDILLLSASQSTGLRDWLIANGYKIPATADAVLEPYIKSNMKFFVAKVNLKEVSKSKFEYLSPIQISFEHEKFMLPIRLGMANSKGSQDMIVYAFTKTGRIECTNYRTIKMPTDKNIPLFVRDEFGAFYKNLFQKTWKNENRNGVFLEYAWDVTPNWGMKCDPCVGPPPLNQEFADAGVWWANAMNGERTFFTRLHVRYEKEKFPSDLNFQVTPNNEQFQARYVLTNPASGEFDCEEGQVYIETLLERRKLEVDEYAALTGRTSPKSTAYINEYMKYKKPGAKKNNTETPFLPGSNMPWKKLIIVFGLCVVTILVMVRKRKVVVV
jgi:Na+-translocating ferredoxin:NAD+ oxidoreductase RnfD subunit